MQSRPRLSLPCLSCVSGAAVQAVGKGHLPRRQGKTPPLHSLEEQEGPGDGEPETRGFCDGLALCRGRLWGAGKSPWKQGVCDSWGQTHILAAGPSTAREGCPLVPGFPLNHNPPVTLTQA